MTLGIFKIERTQPVQSSRNQPGFLRVPAGIPPAPDIDDSAAAKTINQFTASTTPDTAIERSRATAGGWPTRK